MLLIIFLILKSEVSCFYIGGYEKIDLPTLKKKTPTINIEGLNMYNILIDNYPCGVSFNELN